MKTLYLDHKGMPEEARKLFNQAFPGYSGRKFKIRGVSHAINMRSYWDGGSRNYFAVVSMGGTFDMPVQSAYDPPVSGSDEFTIPPGMAVVEHSIFCGRDTGLTLIVPEERLSALLPGPATDITDDQRKILEIIASYIPKVRRDYAREAGIDFETVRDELIITGLLRKNGSITPEGRNMVAGRY